MSDEQRHPMAKRRDGEIFEDTFTEYRTLDARVRESLQRWRDFPDAVLYAPLHSPGILTVILGERRIVLIEAPAWTRGGRGVDESVARAVDGEAILILVGSPDEDLHTLRARGVYDVLPHDASDLSLVFALRRAVDAMQTRAETEPLRRYRFEFGVAAGFVSAVRAAGSGIAACELCVATCQQVMRADAGSLYLAEGDGSEAQPQWLRLAVASAHSGSPPPVGLQLPLGTSSVAGAVAVMRAPVMLEDAYGLTGDAPYRFDASVDARTRYRTRSMLTVPIEASRGDLLGVLQLINRKHDAASRVDPARPEVTVVPFDERDRDLAVSLAGQLGLYLDAEALRADVGAALEGLVHATARLPDANDRTLSAVMARLGVVGRRVLDKGGGR